MAKVTFVTGLCGSGKTHLSEPLAAKTGARLFEGIVGREEIPDLLQCLRDGIDCVVEEIGFCRPGDRDWIVRRIKEAAPETQIEWLCYENDLESANWNVTHRTNKGDVEGHLEINSRVHLDYTYPSGCTIIPITRIDPTSVSPAG